jgi:hypothetical protein
VNIVPTPQDLSSAPPEESSVLKTEARTTGAAKGVVEAVGEAATSAPKGAPTAALTTPTGEPRAQAQSTDVPRHVAPDAAVPNAAPDDLKVGDKLEGRYMSGFDWFPCKILEVQRYSPLEAGGAADVRYTVRYDDGDEEEDCPRRKLRRRGERSAYEGLSVLPVGLVVDAPCEVAESGGVLGGNSNCLPCVILSGPRLIRDGKSDGYEVEFDLASLELATQLPGALQSKLRNGKAVEIVSRERIVTLHGAPIKSGTASAQNLPGGDRAENEGEEVARLLERLRDNLDALGPRSRTGERMKEVFEAADQDGTNSVDKKEFLRIMTELNVKFLPKEADMIFRRYDRNGSGDLDYEEFLRVLNFQTASTQHVSRSIR